MKVLIPEPIAQSGKDYLLSLGYELDDQVLHTEEDLMNRIPDFDALLIRTMPCGRNVLKEAAKLKVISKHGVGFDNIDVDYCTKAGIQVVSTPEAICNSVAEHALYLMIACAKNAMQTYIRFRSEHDFRIRNTILGKEMAGSTAGILGLGRIGRSLAEKCAGIGMNVIGYDPYVTQEQVEPYIKITGREEVIRQADFLSMNMPLNDETRGAFGAREFSMMKKDAIFINAARGGLVQEDALIGALKSGTILGAGIDVFSQEPPAADNPLFTLENVIVTPHQAGSTAATLSRMSLHAAIGIDQVLSGKPVSWPLNHPI